MINVGSVWVDCLYLTRWVVVSVEGDTVTLREKGGYAKQTYPASFLPQTYKKEATL